MISLTERMQTLKDTNVQAGYILEEIKEDGISDKKAEDLLIQYIGKKLLLNDQELSDNITFMVQQSVANALHIEITDLPGVDTPGRCGNASAVLGKRISLFLSLQKDLGITIPAKLTPGILTVRELYAVIKPLLQELK